MVQKSCRLQFSLCSTYVSVVGCWFMNHVIYLKLRQKWLLLKRIISFCENSCHFVNLFGLKRKLFLSHFEINPVIQEPTANNTDVEHLSCLLLFSFHFSSSCWLMNHVIYLKLRQKWLLLKRITIFCENSRHFVNLFGF